MLLNRSIARLLAVIAVLSLWAVFPVEAQEAEWKRLVQETQSLYGQGRYAPAMVSAKEALRVAENTFGPDHPDVAVSLSNLAELYRSQGRYAETEPLYRRALAIREKALGLGHPEVGASLNNLALLYVSLGRYAEAETLYRRSLEIKENAFGPDHPDVALGLNNLAAVYRIQRQFTPSEALYRRALAIREKALGPDHPRVAISLNNLAVLHVEQGLHAQAEPLYRRSLAILEKALGPDHLHVAIALNNLAEIFQIQGRSAESEALYKRSLAIREKALGSDHPDVAQSLNNLAKLYNYSGQYVEAEPLMKQALGIWEKALGPDHPEVALGLNNLAALYRDQQQYAQALSYARQASAIYRKRILDGGDGDSAVIEAASNRKGFLLHLGLISRNPGQEPFENITDQALQVAQLADASGTAAAIAKMAARFAGGNDALASLVRQKQDAVERRLKAERQLIAAAGKPPQERSPAFEKRLREEIGEAAKAIGVVDSELSRRFPEYQELARPEPLPVGQVRALLLPGEAMLVYTLGENPRGEEGFLWVITPQGAFFFPLQVKVKEVADKVAAVRAEMEFDDAGRLPRVSVSLLHDLYQKLFAPAIPHLVGVKHIMVVPSGPLQSLPPGMLVASLPPQIKSDADYRQVDWLARQYAFSVLPTVGSIQAFRRFAKAGGAREPFAGFGDPLIGAPGGTTRGKRGKIDVAAVFRQRAVRPEGGHSRAETELADVEAIRKAPRLPETADELRAMGKVLKAGSNALWLQENASETRVKGLDLSQYRTIAFATHGVMAGEIKGVGESGLILTPPRQASIEDDGYLSASEIARLKLNADWVVLSACNTAAADGTPGAEGLSGLAKAFFYAGARSLLVSHWPVASEATVVLTTAMMTEYEANPSQGKAEAHRKAMMALMATPNHPEYAHPLFWAPFVVVGEGGVGMTGKADTGNRAR